MPVGGTWLIPAAIGAAGVASSVIGAGAAKSAAQTQAAAANQATQAQLDIYNQNKATLAPFVAQGSNAGSALARLLGTDGSNNTPTPPPQVGDPNYQAFLDANPDIVNYYNQTPAAQANGSVLDFAKTIAQQQPQRGPVPTYTAADVGNWQPPPTSQEAALQKLPGYQFTRDQGVQQVNRSLGSMGVTGAQAKGISRFVTGLADSTYNSQVANLQNATNTGEAAGAAQAGVGANTGSGISNTIVGAGTANAAGTVGAANAISGGLSSIPNALLVNSLLTKNGATTPGSNGIYGDLSLGNPVVPGG